MKRLMLIFMIVITCFTFSKEYQVAVMDVVSSGDINNSKILETAVSENLITAFSMSDHFKVVERSYIDQIIKEQEVQLSGLTKSEEAVQLGKIAGVDYIILGTVSKVDRLYILNLRMVSVEDGMIEKAASSAVHSKEELISKTLDMPKMILGENEKKIKTRKKLNLKKIKMPKIGFRLPDKINISCINILELSWNIDKHLLSSDSEFVIGLADISYKEYFKIMGSEKFRYYYSLGLGFPVTANYDITADQEEGSDLDFVFPKVEFGIYCLFERYFFEMGATTLVYPSHEKNDDYYWENDHENVEVRLNLKLGYEFN